MSELFDPLQATGPVASTTDDTAWLQALLDAEAALAGALADAGLIPAAHAETIAAACRAELYDAREIGRAAVGIGNPAAPLVRALTAEVARAEAPDQRDTTPAAGLGDTAAGDSAAAAVHLGATSQDIMDTAAMLIAARALDALDAQARECADLLAELVRQHAETPQVGRSLLQQALPVTFGLSAASRLSGLEAAADELGRVRRERLAAQLGGAVGTLASLGDSGVEVATHFARRLDLPAPELPWHTERTRIAELAGALGTMCGAVAKIARDVTLLAQTEVGEVSEESAGAGGSSTMPHKRNAIAAISAVAAAAQAPGLVATLFSAAGHEHQRAAGSWHAEWRPLNELLRATGSAVYWLRESLSRLRIHPGRMRENLARTGGLLMAERVTTALTPAIGRLAAHDAVTACAQLAIARNSSHRTPADEMAASDTADNPSNSGTPSGSADFGALLAAHPVIGAHLDRHRIDALLEPSTYLGSTAVFVRRALLAHAERQDEARQLRGGVPSDDLPVTVFSVVDGDPAGIPLVLINALGSDLSIWDGYVQPLVDNGFRVIRFDARGHGESPVPAGPYRLADLGADVVALLDRLGIKAAHIVGVSLGGMTGLWLARHHPDRVRGLVVCCSSAQPGNAAMWLERAEQARSEGMRQIADGSVTRWFTPEWLAQHPETAQYMRDLTAATTPAGYAACCAALSGLDLTDDLPHIAVPTAVLSTAQDPAFPPEHGRAIAAGIPNARLEIIDGAAHLGPIERPEPFLSSIIDHLRGIR
ncbi:3-oxoadipate enol-lactonase [Nocardia sp. SYP-A9097]|uniref:3-oxoadipate enol-lactonase n=1 Tax=Nocardia sp. SYP-A9097 TaxID=2663237 RepID=UPI00129C0ACC|nr:3-oxoadipate enol-lactonase [Nocardia sp. SYP-A9097]